MICLPSELVIGVDESRLVSEIGQLFGSITDALAEVVQNAWRAGARNLNVRANGSCLILTDDGPGLNDPGLLFTIARSGWRGHVATDPAGMGAFALFALAEHVEVTSVSSSGTAWVATFGPEAFAGASILIRELECSGPTGLSILARLKPEVRLPDLYGSHWRHRFPLCVTVSVDGGEPRLVPSVPAWDGKRIETPVGVIVLAPDFTRQGAADGIRENRSYGVWEHRIVRFPENPIARIRDHLPSSLSGALVSDALDRRSIMWEMDPASTRARPKLPDRTTLIDDAALDDAMRVIAASLVQQVDEPGVLQNARGGVRDRDIIPEASIGPIDARTALGALGNAFRLTTVLPFLGFVRARRAVFSERFRVSLTVNADEHTDAWEETTDPVWVRPRYRVEANAVAILALADGIAAAPAGAELPGVDDLPLLRLDADTLTAATSIGQVFARGLRYVTEGRAVGPVSFVYSRCMGDEGAEHALPPKWRAALGCLRPGPPHAHDVWFPDSYWLGLHPLPAQCAPIDYVRSSQAFRWQALRESADHEWPLWFWDFADAHQDSVDASAFVRELTDRLATELGPATAQAVRRETAALALAERFADTASELRWRILTPGATPFAGYDAEPPAVVAKVHAATSRLCGLLLAASVELQHGPGPLRFPVAGAGKA